MKWQTVKQLHQTTLLNGLESAGNFKVGVFFKGQKKKEETGIQSQTNSQDT